MLDFLLPLIAIFIVAPMVVGPFLVKFTHWIAARAVIKTILPEALDEKTQTFIDQSKIELEALGFQFAGYQHMTDYMPKMTCYFGLFRHDNSKSAAMAAVIEHTSGRRLQYCEFSTTYSNGRIMDVNNSPEIGGYNIPDKVIYRYPKISSLRKLHEINQWVTARDPKKSVPVGLVADREAEMVAEALDREAAIQEKNGFYVLNENRSRYRLTWKGAFIMTERQVFPFKQILSYFDRQAAKKAIAGMPDTSII